MFKLFFLATIDLSENFAENVVGVVCQDGSVLKFPGLIQLTPGVAVNKGNLFFIHY